LPAPIKALAPIKSPTVVTDKKTAEKKPGGEFNLLSRGLPSLIARGDPLPGDSRVVADRDGEERA
jgi:hypothetical protein